MNTFGENVLGRSGPDLHNASRPVVSTRSNFPDAVDRLTDAPQYNPYQASNQAAAQPKPTPAKVKPPMAHRVNKPLPSNTQYNDLVDNLHEVNSEMGQLLAKCVNVLERELFPDIDDEEKAGEGETSEGQTQPSIKEEASVIMALVGIKHVRDVLLGKQRELDLSVANQIAQMNISQSNNTQTEEVPKPSNTADASAIGEDAKDDNQQEEEEVVKELVKEDTKLPAVAPEPAAAIAPPARPPPPFKALTSTYVSPNPLPPKPNVSYNIEDLLSDTLKDGGSATRVNNKDKFSWMMESSPTPAGKKLGSSSSLFSSSAPGSSPSRSAAKRSGNRSPATSAVSVDPLDARHAERQKFYDDE
jgi:TBC1 domain family protein 5